MSSISVELPENLKAFVDEKARQGGFSDAGGYIVALVAAASEKGAEIELALLQGLASGPAEPWTADEWTGIRRRVTDRKQDA
jgi:antitoxin ParD1/3/4